ncbi:hypothetical protein PTUN_a0496 [Pseudoalteromonas tunicata]|jgi:multidrug efflux pump subunit AcrB|nr:hypothetical protein PTUN_a0496 [Pseudoalteromonas tunicata]
MVPSLEQRNVTVTTYWSGATPQDIEKSILMEQEKYLSSLPNLLKMTSNAQVGQGEIILEFPFGTDIKHQMINISNALGQVPDYPENVDAPKVIGNTFANEPFMYFSLIPLAGNPLNIDMLNMKDFAQDVVRPQLERVEGISQVGVSGGEEKQIQIELDPYRLAQRGLTVTDIREKIRQRNRDMSVGDTENHQGRFFIRTTGRFTSIEELKALVVKSVDGSIVRLEDVASVRLGNFEHRKLAYFDAESNITLSMYRNLGTNVIDIKHRVLETVVSLNKQLESAGLRVEIIGDDVKYVQSSLKNVWVNLTIGAILAIAILYAFLRTRLSFVIGFVGIPICTLAAFLGLHLFGRTINVISLAGVAFAIGMVVDNSIVVLESIERCRQNGMDKINAALNGVKDVTAAVVASTLTTVLAFLPVTFVKQEAGQLYSDIAIAICSAIIASMVVALLVLPVLYVRFEVKVSKVKMTKVPKIFRVLNRYFHRPLYRNLSVAAILVFTVWFITFKTPPSEYLPAGEEPKAFTFMFAPPGFSFTRMQEISNEVRIKLKGHQGQNPQLFDKGDVSIPSLKYVLMSVSAERMWVLTEPTRAQDLEAMMTSLASYFKSYEKMTAFSSRGSIISSNDGGSRAVNIDISTADLKGLYESASIAKSLAEEMFESAQIRSEPSALTLDQPLVEIKPNWQKLAELDIHSQDLNYFSAAMVDGVFADEIFLNDKKVDIYLYGNLSQPTVLENLEAVPYLAKEGISVPFGALVDFDKHMGTTSIRRIDGFRTATVRIVPPQNVALESAIIKVRDELIPTLKGQQGVPGDLKVSITGAADQLSKTQASLSKNFLVAALITFLLLVVIFKHWGFPVLILSTVPLGIAGGIFGLALLNTIASLAETLGISVSAQPFDMITMLGFLILLGVVINNPILIVDKVRGNLVGDNVDPILAVKNAVFSRYRPILISTLTTIFGLVPLVFIPGEGTELYRGLGVIVLSGILFSAFITLFFMPALLILILELQQKYRKARITDSTNAVTNQVETTF